jgi:hypothetical protein
VTPEFSSEGTTLYFSGDARGAYNLYGLDLETGGLVRFTDVRTGIFFPGSLPGRPGTRLFSAFNKGAFQLFLTEDKGVPEERQTFVDWTGAPAKRSRPKSRSPSTRQDRPQETGQAYVASRPPPARSSRRTGRSTAAHYDISDLLANHIFSSRPIGSVISARWPSTT